MATKVITESVEIGGVTLRGSVTRQGENAVIHAPDAPVAVGKVGALTTRTDDNTGELTMNAGHGITTGAKITLFWSGGMRYGLTVGTVATNAVPIDGGAGDNLPADESPIVACVETVISDFAFTGNNAKIIAVSATRRSVFQLQQADGTVHLAAEIEAGGIYLWKTGTNPVAGDTIGKLVYANGDSAQTLLVNAGVLLDV